MKKMSSKSAPMMLAVSSILVPDNMPNRRAGWDKNLDELLESIKVLGLIQPIVVVPLEKEGPNGETYKLVAGQRRLECIKRLKRTAIKAVSLAADTNKKQEFGAKVAENFVRMDYSPLEEAVLIDYAINQCKMSQQEFAKMVGKTPGWVSQRLTATKQPVNVQQALENKEITFTHVRELARVKDEGEKAKLLERAKKENAQEFKERIDEVMGGKPKKKPEERASNNEEGNDSDRKPRPRREAISLLGKLDKAFVAARKAEDKMRALQLSWFMKGVSWAYKLEGANPPKLDGLPRKSVTDV